MRLSACFARRQCRFRRSTLILQPLALFLLPSALKHIFLIVDSSRQCNDVIVASGSAGTLSEYELWSLQRASHSSSSTSASIKKRSDDLITPLVAGAQQHCEKCVPIRLF